MTFCLQGHAHATEQARRGCDVFGRAVARFDRIDARHRGHLLDDDRAYLIWREAGNLVNRLFTIAMSDVVDVEPELAR